MSKGIIILILGIIIFPFSAKADFVSHEAVYELELAEPPKASLGLTGASGLMKYKTEKSCDGWLSNTDFALKLLFSGLGEEKKFWSISSFESFDGLFMDFASQIYSEGVATEKFKGKAIFPAKNTEGRAEFNFPEKVSVFLPKGTFFPTSFNKEMLASAKKGKKNITATVFDGSGFDAVTEVNVFINPNKNNDYKEIEGDKELISLPSYNFAMAFFPYSAQKDEAGSLPSYEIKSVMFENGISAELIQDFGSFKIRAKLRKIRLLPESKCQ